MANVFHHGEADATDNIFSDTPTVDGDQRAAQNFAGCHSKLASVHPFCYTSEKQTLGVFQDCVRCHGAPNELVADNASIYHGFKFMKYVCNLYVRLWQSQTYHQHQNLRRMFGNPSNKAPTGYWISQVHLRIYSCVHSYIMSFFGTIRLTLLLVMEVLLLTPLLLVVLMILLRFYHFVFMN